MALYELRTYTLHVGKMAEAVKLYQEIGFPALQKGSHDKKLIGYFQADTGTINQIVHLWKFEDDADRRAHWAAVFANKDFVEGFRIEVPAPRRRRASDMRRRAFDILMAATPAGRDPTRAKRPVNGSNTDA